MEFPEQLIRNIYPLLITAGFLLGPFFAKRFIRSLDENTKQLEKHSAMFTEFFGRLDRLADKLDYSTDKTRSEVSVVRDHQESQDKEIDLLRDRVHKHGNMITEHKLQIELILKRAKDE